MKTPRLFATGLALAILSTLIPQPSTLFAQGAAFTHQGVLNDQGASANGVYDLQFILFAGPTGGGPIGPLNQKLEQQVKEKDAKICSLENRLAELEKMVATLASGTVAR